MATNPWDPSRGRSSVDPEGDADEAGEGDFVSDSPRLVDCLRELRPALAGR